MSSDEAPERIWLQLGNEPTTYGEALRGGAEISWCAEQIDEYDVEYIRSDLRLSPETIERIRMGMRGRHTETTFDWCYGVEALLRDILKECGENEDEQ